MRERKIIFGNNNDDEKMLNTNAVIGKRVRERRSGRDWMCSLNDAPSVEGKAFLDNEIRGSAGRK